ncbi:MAG: metallophosphoesterase [Oscillospiraceae bacterium]|nr:metallophosphoesterase [Oscillospiraceae bacterium]
MKKRTVILSAVFTAVSVLISLVFCGFRFGFVFVDHLVFDGFCYCVWALFILNSCFMFAHLRSALTREKLCGKALFAVNCAVTVLSVVASITFLIIGKNDIKNYVYMSFEWLPILAVIYGLVFFIAIFPLCKGLFKKCTAVVAALAIVTAALVHLFPVGGFDFEAAPTVFDTGDSYHVVFATNRDSVGYISYSYGGEDYFVWDTTTGRKDSSTVHSIEVAYEHLDNNSYTIGAVRATEDIAYGGHLGKDITYKVDKFSPCPDDGFNMAIVTDNHDSQVDWSSVGSGAQLCVFLGDISNGLYSYANFVDNLIVPAGKATGGAIPVIYARGNHDHRGSAVKDMLKELDFDEYYYRVRIGNYVFTVLDTGEDKDDGNYEYAGYNDYVSYFAEQTAWAQSLEKETGYNVVIAHSHEPFHGASEPISSILKDLGVGFSINGHQHTEEFVSAQDSVSGIPYYICGHYVNKNDLYYTVMHFENGKIDIVTQNTAGDTINSAEIQLEEVK